MKPPYSSLPSDDNARPRRLRVTGTVCDWPSKFDCCCQVTPLNICRASRISSNGRLNKGRRRLELRRAARWGSRQKKRLEFAWCYSGFLLGRCVDGGKKSSPGGYRSRDISRDLELQNPPPNSSSTRCGGDTQNADRAHCSTMPGNSSRSETICLHSNPACKSPPKRIKEMPDVVRVAAKKFSAQGIKEAKAFEEQA